MRITLILLFVSALVVFSGCSDERTCGAGTVADGGTCVPDVPQGCPDKYIEQDGECVPEVLSCGLGTTLRDGVCVPTVTDCALGTHLQDGECVPDLAIEPNADVMESADGTPAAFTLPMADHTVSLGGVVNTPIDENGDGYVDGNWDVFTFNTPSAGTHLRITASSVGATLPTFAIFSTLTDDGDPPQTLYRRWSLEPNHAENSREVYLPYDDTYILVVTDYANMWSYLYNYPDAPVGGDEHTYHVVVENLGTPTPTVVASLPFSDSGSFDDGAVRFYSLADNAADIAAFVRSVGEPVDNVPNNVMATLTTLDTDGNVFAEANAPGSSSNVDQFLPAGAEYLLVYDFGLIVGPNRDYAFDITEELRLQCGTETCSGTGFEDDHALLGWSLEEGDFLAVGVYPDRGQVEVTLLDSSLDPLLPAEMGSTFRGGGFAYFADSTQQIYMRIYGGPDSRLTTYDVEEIVVSTTLLESSTSQAGLSTTALPDDIFDDAGLAYLQGLAGDLVVFDPLQPHGAGWLKPTETLYTSNLEVIGPSVDSFGDDFPNDMMAPMLAQLPADGDYLHALHDDDEEADISTATYDTGYLAITPTALTPPTPGTPTVLAGQSLMGGYAAYTLASTAWERADIVVTPVSGLRAEVWLLTRGKSTYASQGSWWEADATSLRLGLVGHRQATSPGDEITLEHVSVAHDAEYVIVVVDVDGSGQIGFDLSVSAYAAPANDACANAQVIDFTDGSATINGTTAGAQSSLDLDWNNDCTGEYTPGPDLFYAIDLAANTEVSFTVRSGFNVQLYLVSSCDPTCVTGASTDATSETFNFTPTTGGRYFIVVDGVSPAELGDFTLEVALVE